MEGRPPAHPQLPDSEAELAGCMPEAAQSADNPEAGMEPDIHPAEPDMKAESLGPAMETGMPDYLISCREVGECRQ